jgi:hypothetical protein
MEWSQSFRLSADDLRPSQLFQSDQQPAELVNRSLVFEVSV